MIDKGTEERIRHSKSSKGFPLVTKGFALVTKGHARI